MPYTRGILLSALALWSMSHLTLWSGEVERRGPSERIRHLLERQVSIDFAGQSLNAAIEHLREKAHLPLSVDQVTLMQMNITTDNTGQVEIKANQEKASQVLRKVLNAYHLAYVIIDESILITTEEMALHRQMRQRVNVDVQDIPFQKAARDLARIHGINLVIDPKITKQVHTSITLKLESVGVETSIRIMAELVEVKVARMGNVLFVTTEERANKIHQEENSLPTPPAEHQRIEMLGGR